VRLDGNASALKLGFAAEQLFYKDAVEKPENLELIRAALNTLFGREFKITVQRVSAGTTERTVTGVTLSVAAPAAPAAPAIASRASAPQATASASAPEPDGTDEPDDPDVIESDVETEVEFDGAGELPLPAAPRRAANSARARMEEESSARAPYVPAAPLRRDAAPLSPVNLKAVEDHPLVKLVLKETQGTVMNVTQSAPKKAAAADAEKTAGAK
jgi:hypothetical protein